MRKRSKYRPYRCDPGAWAHAIGMTQPMTDDQLTDLGMAVHTSIERMRTGHGIELDWHTLAAAVNVSLVLCERGIGPDYLDDVIAAQEALMRIFERQRTTGRWAFDGPAYTALACAIELHEAQLQAITRDGARAAMLEVRRRIDRGEVFVNAPCDDGANA